MLRHGLLLAQMDPKELEALKEAAKPPVHKVLGTDVTVILGVVLALIAILFFWAFFIRKRPKRRPDHPDNWGRNPTLGETGGLPPARPEEPEAPPPAPQSPSPR